MRSAFSKTSGATVQVMRTPSTSIITCGKEVGYMGDRPSMYGRWSVVDGHAAYASCMLHSMRR